MADTGKFKFSPKKRMLRTHIWTHYFLYTHLKFKFLQLLIWPNSMDGPPSCTHR